MNSNANEADRVLFAEERKKQLVEYITRHRRVTVPELCDSFSVSSATIRNDLRELDEAGLITRTHGGAIKKTQTSFETVIDNRAGSNPEGKNYTAVLALEDIKDNDTIILDAGTTTQALARLLYQKKNLSVVTNDFKIASILENEEYDCEVYFIGGLLRKGFHCTVVNGMLSMLNSLSVDKAFMGANSFSVKKGAGTPDMTQAEIKKQMIGIANKVVILCDSSKLETDSFVTFALPEQVDLLVTDSISPEVMQLYTEKDICVKSATS